MGIQGAGIQGAGIQGSGIQGVASRVLGSVSPAALAKPQARWHQAVAHCRSLPHCPPESALGLPLETRTRGTKSQVAAPWKVFWKGQQKEGFAGQSPQGLKHPFSRGGREEKEQSKTTTRVKKNLNFVIKIKEAKPSWGRVWSRPCPDLGGGQGGDLWQ